MKLFYRKFLSLTILIGLFLVGGILVVAFYSEAFTKDNCQYHPNASGSQTGTCTRGQAGKDKFGTSCSASSDCGGSPAYCSKNQEDEDNDKIGDACDPNTCGNGIIEKGETCESNGGTGLSDQWVCDNCQASGGYCGDGTINSPYETCESSGGTDPTVPWVCDNCQASGGYCGDGKVNPTYEECEGTAGGGTGPSDPWNCNNCQGGGSGHCGDKTVNSPYEVCDGNTQSCQITYSTDIPLYCTALGVTGTQTCNNDCQSWGACNAPAPQLISDNYGDCSLTSILLTNYGCCELIDCHNDGCCGGKNSGDAGNPPSGYTLRSTKTNTDVNKGNCKLAQNGDDWLVMINHTTAGYQCWK